MPKPRRIGISLEDDGSLKRFFKRAPEVFLAVTREAIKDGAAAVDGRMRAYARVGPDAPHIKNDVETRLAKKSASVGYLKAEPAGGTDTDATQPDVALYQNYGTKKAHGDRFMERAADDSANEFGAAMVKALKAAERKLAI